MAQYYVIAQDGNRYGPADIPTLQQWINENRILPTTMLEDAATGQQLPASALGDLQFPTIPVQPVTPSQPTVAVTPQTPTPGAGPIYGRGSQVTYGQPGMTPVNTSGMRGDVPPEIEALKWNWGAYGCSCLWLLFHGLVLGAFALFGFSLLMGVVMGALGVMMGNMLITSLIGFIIGQAVAIWLGLNGHKLAWRYKRYDSVDDYLRSEQIWLVLGILGFIISLIAIIPRILFSGGPRFP